MPHNTCADPHPNASPPTATPTPRAMPTPTLPPSGVGAQTLTFDDLTRPNRTLRGEYPHGVLDWGTADWYLSGPFGEFSTLSIGFNGPGPTSAPITFLVPRRLVRLDAFNGGRVASTVTVTCQGLPTVSQTLAPRQLATIDTGWRSAWGRSRLAAPTAGTQTSTTSSSRARSGTFRAVWPDRTQGPGQPSRKFLGSVSPSCSSRLVAPVSSNTAQAVLTTSGSEPACLCCLGQWSRTGTNLECRPSARATVATVDRHDIARGDPHRSGARPACQRRRQLACTRASNARSRDTSAAHAELTPNLPRELTYGGACRPEFEWQMQTG